MPFDCVRSDTNKSPMSIGSILGIFNSGMPRTKYGRMVSILFRMQPIKFGSLFLHMCKYGANYVHHTHTHTKCKNEKIKRKRKKQNYKQEILISNSMFVMLLGAKKKKINLNC